MGGAGISSHGLACAPPAAVPLNPRARRVSAATAGHRSSPQLLLRSDLPAHAALCRARAQSSSSSNVVSAEGNFGRGDDADKLLEDLLKQHGEVVYSSGGSPAAEADDDAECLSCTCLPALPIASPALLMLICVIASLVYL
ncbi:hypothetical protein BAE44_0006889 [Dichanthelium oligosanthes]|uniref:Uncharacterized protein n=1 Tax=Dichanthelium oligosanthes TaxID=888268 RepID=A0A1E5W457_9POAL|nr:hypothetical protein BAE44_0006889 [Dichanthelium oligosanthes]